MPSFSSPRRLEYCIAWTARGASYSCIGYAMSPRGTRNPGRIQVPGIVRRIIAYEQVNNTIVSTRVSQQKTETYEKKEMTITLNMPIKSSFLKSHSVSLIFWGHLRHQNAIMGCCSPMYSKGSCNQKALPVHPCSYIRLMSRSNAISPIAQYQLSFFLSLLSFVGYSDLVAYSTVTDLAKFLGKSTFKPSATASQ
jgi:hypothetical protein